MGFKAAAPGAPPDFRLDRGVRVRPLALDDAAGVFAAVERNRPHLNRWMPFERRSATLDATRAWIGTRPHFVAERGVTLGVFEADRVVGVVGLIVDRPGDDGAHIGYWIDQERQGRGWTTRVVAAACDYAFANGVARVVIEADTENDRSCAVAERLGFVREGVARSRAWLRDRYRDHAVYAMLAADWARREPGREGAARRRARR